MKLARYQVRGIVQAAWSVIFFVVGEVLFLTGQSLWWMGLALALSLLCFAGLLVELRWGARNAALKVRDAALAAEENNFHKDCGHGEP